VSRDTIQQDDAGDLPRPSNGGLLRHGQSSDPAPLVPLRAGPIRLLYDPASGFIRQLCLGDREILRGIYAALRDQNWGTVPGVLRELRSKIGQDFFEIEFEVTHCRDEILFVWRGSVRGDADGTVRYDLDGEARSNFLRNRIGFCILHPIRECAGANARQTRTDGRIVECRFPTVIEPQIFGRASFQDLRAVAHEIEPGMWMEIDFEGDVFEMEDQRNWTDASFKTYCTPLALPFPVKISAGNRVRQSVCLRLTARHPTQTAHSVAVFDKPARVTVVMPAAPAGRVPSIGFGVASHHQPLTSHEISRLRALAPAHLRVDVKLAAADWAEAWDETAHRVSQLGLGVELALHLPRDIAPDLKALAEALRRTGVPLVRILVLRDGESATRRHTLTLVRQHLAVLDVPIGGGSDCNFCELNREQALGQFALADCDFVFWPITPQVHAFDHLSLVESIEAQPHTIQSARGFADKRPLIVSPITLKQRFNPVATGPEAPPPPGELPPQVDPRQLSLFGAGWTVGSLAALACAGAESLTYYEITGWRGVMETVSGAANPAQFPSRPGQVYPLYHVFAGVVGCSATVPVNVSNPLAVTAFALFDRGGLPRLLLANVTDSARLVRISGWSQPNAQVRVLDESNALEMTDHPDHFLGQPVEPIVTEAGMLTMELPPFAFARIDACAASDSSKLAV
jgi:D-apionolactonase